MSFYQREKEWRKCPVCTKDYTCTIARQTKECPDCQRNALKRERMAARRRAAGVPQRRPRDDP